MILLRRASFNQLTQIRDEVGALYEDWEKLGYLLDELPQEE